MMWSQWRDKLKELTEEALDGEGGGEVDAVQVPFLDCESRLRKQLELEEATRTIERLNGQLATKTQEASAAIAKCEELQAKLTAEELLHRKTTNELKQSGKRHEDELQALRKKSKDLYGQVQALQQLRQISAAPPGGTKPAAAAGDDLADITDVITSDTHSGGLEVHMNALQSQLSTMQEERTQILSLLDSMGVFEVFVKRCTEAVQKGASEMQTRAQAAADSAAEAQRLREWIAQLEAEARERPSVPIGPSAREMELEATLQVAQEKQQKDRALARTKIEQLVAERASLQQQLASAREAQEQLRTSIAEELGKAQGETDKLRDELQAAKARQRKLEEAQRTAEDSKESARRDLTEKLQRAEQQNAKLLVDLEEERRKAREAQAKHAEESLANARAIQPQDFFNSLLEPQSAPAQAVAPLQNEQALAKAVSELAEARDELAKVTSQVAEVRNELATQQARTRDAEVRLEQERGKWRAAMDEMSANIDAERTAKEAEAARAAQAQRSSAEHERQACEGQREVATLRSEVQRLQEAAQTQAADEAAEAEKGAQLEKRVQQQLTELSAVKATLKAEQEKHARDAEKWRSEQTEALQQREAGASSTAAGLRAEIGRLEASAQSKAHEVEQLRSALEALKRNAEKERETVGAQRKEAEEMLAAQAKAVASLEEQIATTKTALQELTHVHAACASKPAVVSVHTDEENAALKAQVTKLTTELERLRSHLIETEEAREQLDADNEAKVTDLQSKLHEAHNKEVEIRAQIVELARSANERDELRQELDARQHALLNLQSVVEQLQAELETKTNAEILHLNTQMSEFRTRMSEAHAQLAHYKEMEGRFIATEKRKAELEGDVEAARRTESRLTTELETTRRALDQSLTKLGAQARDEENYVDKRFVKKLILTFMEKGARKSDALQIMARILNFTDAEKAAAGLGGQGGSRWFPSFLRGASSAAPAGAAHTDHPPKDGNLRDLWVEFLLNEADRTDAAPRPAAAAAPAPLAAAAPIPAAAPTPKPVAAGQNPAG